jgi:hypothetical protein
MYQEKRRRERLSRNLRRRRCYWRPHSGRAVGHVCQLDLQAPGTSLFYGQLSGDSPTMSLCSTCTSIPFRALDRLFHSDAKTKLAAVLENVVWLDKSNSKFEEKSENCAVANKYHKESADEEQDAEEPELHPWFKHKRAQQISEDASECVLCRFISFELSAMPEERTPYDGEHLEGFYGSSSTSGDSSKNEVIWIKIRKNFFEICRENLIRSGTLNRTVWLRSIAGKYDHSKDGK